MAEGITGNLILNNAADGVIDGNIDLESVQAGSVTITNAGKMEKMEFSDFADGVATTVNNLAGGVITSDAAGLLIRGGGDLTINNDGQILTKAKVVGPNGQPISLGGTAIDFGGGENNFLHNTGRIEGGGHAVTGESSLTVVNEATGVMIATMARR